MNTAEQFENTVCMPYKTFEGLLANYRGDADYIQIECDKNIEVHPTPKVKGVTVSEKHFKELQAYAYKFHKLLDAAGVDNWEGFECFIEEVDNEN